ncbi:S8 family serine peptidase [Actinoplanes sp. NEAU-A12]|uniref:S8 family serine peptidase n=1 Tax=Actinoplanes sandaracinus TaxID=3045177 RepID=A0ABT6WT31_9ACTN|nr:S8 family serine peptidase [Actinoplanes sandaracinus]MDI6099006.1 S8 family serine peptidase [Actinoplanes sandaracinus]MDI6102901.1 S8 family serine peptidase [Actinoplanes sandaracinus]
MRIVSTSLAALLLTGLTAVPVSAADTTTRLVVGLTDSADPAVVVAALGGRASEPQAVPGLKAITVTVPTAERAAALSTLAADASVRYAEADGTVVADADPDEASNRRSGWNNQIPFSWTWSTGSPSVTVAVVDSGVSPTDDLKGPRLLPGRDLVDGDADPADDDNHGTMVANTIAAQHGNGAGGTGVCGRCSILPVRVLSRQSGIAKGYTSTVAAGIVWAAQQDARVINLSLSTPTRSRLLEEAVETATAAGSLVVASAGDDSSLAPYYPAAIESVLAVGSAGAGGRPANASNRNGHESTPWVDIAADRHYEALNARSQSQVMLGTSVSAALVSGVAALGLSVKPNLDGAALRAAILASAGRGGRMEAEDAPVLDAAGLLHDLGAADDVAPQITSVSPADQLLPGRQFAVTPKIVEDHAIQRYEVESEGRIVRRNHIWENSLVVTPPADRNGPLTYTVRVWDYAGQMAERTATVQVDSTPPTGTIDAPAQGMAVPAGPVDVVFTSATAENLTLVRANDVALTQDGPRRWIGRITPNGLGQIHLNVFDAAGNMTDLSRTVVVDDVAPGGVIETPYAGERIHGPVRVVYTVATTEQMRSVTANGTAMTRIGSTRSWEATIVPPATGDIRVIAEDLVGNRTELTHQVVVDLAGPVATAMSPADAARVRGTFTSTLSGVSDVSGVSKAELSVNGLYVGTDTTAPYALAVRTGTYNGNVDLAWTLTDGFGNTRTYTRRVTADNAGPAVSISKGPRNKARLKGTTKVYVKASDAGGVARVELVVNGKVVARDVKAGYLLSFNASKQKRTMKVLVRAYDKLGNVKSTTTRTWYRK